MTSQAPPSWPKGVDQISVEDLGRLGINAEDQLFWDGRRIEIKRRLDLTGLQKTAAVVVTAMAVLGGLGGFASGFNDASEFLCARNIHLLSCPVKDGAPPAFAKP